MIDYLLTQAFASYKINDTSKKLYICAVSLNALLRCLHEERFSAFVNEDDFSDEIKLEPYSFSDLIYDIVTRDNPSLYTFPLGDIIERSFKQTISLTLLDSPRLFPDKQGQNFSNIQFIKEIYSLSKDINLTTIFETFLSYFLFNQSMTILRGKSQGSTDFGYSYQFLNGKLVSTDEQNILRQAIFSKCNDIAKSLVPYFIDSQAKGRINSKIKRISTGFKEKLPFLSWRDDNSGKRNQKTRINVIVGKIPIKKLSEDYIVDDNAIRIILNGKDKNVSFDLSDIESFVGHPLNSLTRDLLEIAFVIYISDLYIDRDIDYYRELDVYIPVRHPEIWQSQKSSLSKTISYLSRDTINLYFSANNEPKVENIKFTKVENGCSCLFSGGIDSAAGIIWAISKGYSPSLISYASGNLSGIQTRLLDQMNHVMNTDLPHLKVSWQPSRKKKGSYKLKGYHRDLFLQHLRSFFYLSIAYAVSVEVGNTNIFMFENGPIAINPLMSESHVNTHTVHPKFIETYQSTINSVFDLNISISNPYKYKTKGQIVKYIANKRLSRVIIPFTSSCYNYSRVKILAKRLDIFDYQGIHDGDCLPCIIRRVALCMGKTPNKYDECLIDIFNIFESPSFYRLPERTLETMVKIADLLRFSHNLLHTPLEYLAVNFPDLFIYSPEYSCTEITKTLFNFANEVISCFRQKASTELKENYDVILFEKNEHE